MSKTPWTPGPWIIGQPAKHPTSVQKEMENGWLATVANCESLTLEDAECLANARLIAAAPELVEALEALAIHTEDMHIICNRPAEDSESLTKARALLARIRGEA